jgi:predicted amidohydrolase
VIEPAVEPNRVAVERLMRSARRRGARLAHFSEACVSGYLGVEVDSGDRLDWDAVRGAMESIMRLAAELELWVVIGCNHRLSGSHRPHNSLYVIDPSGRIVDRYDKMFCTGKVGSTPGDLDFYSPGSRLVTFEVRGIKCGLQICHDFRYQELYREYKKRGVQLVFHSYHNGGMTLRMKEQYRDIWG